MACNNIGIKRNGMAAVSFYFTLVFVLLVLFAASVAVTYTLVPVFCGLMVNLNFPYLFAFLLGIGFTTEFQLNSCIWLPFFR